MVKCSLIADAPLLRNVFVTPVSAKDWEIIVSIVDLKKVLNECLNFYELKGIK